MASSTLTETAVLTVIRLALAYACRQHLGRLYADLRDLSAERDLTGSSTGTGPSSPLSPGIELDGLPSPALTPSTPSRAKFAASNAARHWPSSISRTVFGACFSESCILFLLVSCQALGVLDSRTRILNWRISLTILSLLMLVVVPLLQCLLLTYRSPVSPAMRVAFTLVPFGVYLFLLSFVTPPEGLASDLSSAYLARYIALGVTILGLLSGFGATSAAWEYIIQPFLFSRSEKWRNITEADVASTELALARIRKDLNDRERALERRQEASANAGSNAGSSWLPRVFGGGDNEAKILQTEMSSLRALESEISSSLARMRRRRAELEFRGTLGGILWLAVGRAFGCYCALRILSTILALILPSTRKGPTTTTTTTTDIGARVIGMVLPYVPLLPIEPSAENAEIIARHASLLLVGAIVLSSVRLVLRGVGRALKVTGRRSGQRNVGASVMLLFLAQLMGTYLLSTLIQLRTSLPPSSTEMLSSLPRYERFEPVFNWAFIGAAGAAGVARAVGWAGQ
ncbi:hypothetical protein EXIGLDRAFT_722235 [Exidia glandulosa HHB12029]|uniref:G protein-coupled receptor 89 n=1 Tax=Exidia glandulosa HHB12029 TaxID=1314781 RepID=A0A165FCX2_EXIGL|nr:hypothetical protein EXIGLDRAFT_722235 [Exidia glandulosa HHB12029]